MIPQTLLPVSIETSIFDILKKKLHSEILTWNWELASGFEFLNFRFLDSWDLKFNFRLIVFRTLWENTFQSTRIFS